MLLPKRIEPNRIKDSLVEVRFTSKLPYEIYLGLIYKSLEVNYKYTNRPQNPQKTINLPIDGDREIKLSLGSGSSLFYNDFIKFEIQRGAIIFNCFDKYVSWEIYKDEIIKVLRHLHNSNVVELYNRIGVRYISEYQDLDIKDITKFEFTFGLPEVSSDNYSFKAEYIRYESRIIISLTSRLPVVTSDAQKKIVTAIDIDVIKEKFDTSDLDNLIQVLEDAHEVEKMTFFSLLKDDFLQSLNPEY